MNLLRRKLFLLLATLFSQLSIWCLWAAAYEKEHAQLKQMEEELNKNQGNKL